MMEKHKTVAVKIGNVVMGGGNPVVVQSMTNTDTADADATARQVIELHKAGSEIVRITVDTEASAQSVARIKEIITNEGYDIPLVGCFHYNGHTLLEKYPECAMALDKYRINPGNVGFKKKRDRNFEIMIEAAIKYQKAVRIGVNWGSLDQELATKMMDDNSKSDNPKPSEYILREALVVSTLSNAKLAEKLGLPKSKIVISCKVSRVQDLIKVYQELAKRSDYALHVGLTEAGMGNKGVVATTSALSILLQQGIGDTIRASLTPRPGESRNNEVRVCQEILQSLDLRQFTPSVTSCPGCGRTTSSVFQELADSIQNYLRDSMPVWKEKYKGVESMNVAVMGCIVNGPGESKHANIGISLPGTGEQPAAPVFVDGAKFTTLRGNNIANEFKAIIDDYVQNTYG